MEDGRRLESLKQNNRIHADLSATRGRCGSIVGITSELCLYTNNARRERIPTQACQKSVDRGCKLTVSADFKTLQ